MPLNINNLTAGTPVTFNAQTSVQRMVFDSSTVAFRIVNNTPGIVTVLEENSDSFICQVDPGATAFGLMQNAILVEAQYSGPVTLTPYTWVPVSSGNTNTFTAQQIFKAPTTIDAGAVFQSTGTISAIPTMDANAIAMFQGTEGTTSHVFFSSSASNAHFVFRRRQGTYASPTAVQSGNVLGAFQWQGYGASTFGSVANAEIRAVAAQAFTDTQKGTNLEFYLSPFNGTTPSLGLQLSVNFIATGHWADFKGSIRMPNNSSISMMDSSSVAESVINVSTANNLSITSPTSGGSIINSVRNASGTFSVWTGGSKRLEVLSGGKTVFSSNAINISTSQSPANNATGTAGDIAWANGFLYVCVATNTWQRVALTGGY